MIDINELIPILEPLLSGDDTADVIDRIREIDRPGVTGNHDSEQVGESEKTTAIGLASRGLVNVEDGESLISRGLLYVKEGET